MLRLVHPACRWTAALPIATWASRRWGILGELLDSARHVMIAAASLRAPLCNEARTSDASPTFGGFVAVEAPG